MTESAGGSVLPDELLCLGCGYDLRQTGRDGVCPDCGLPVAESMDGLEKDEPGWALDLAKGVRWLFYYLIVLVVFVVVLLVSFVVLIGFIVSAVFTAATNSHATMQQPTVVVSTQGPTTQPGVTGTTTAPGGIVIRGRGTTVHGTSRSGHASTSTSSSTPGAVTVTTTAPATVPGATTMPSAVSGVPVPQAGQGGQPVVIQTGPNQTTTIYTTGSGPGFGQPGGPNGFPGQEEMLEKIRVWAQLIAVPGWGLAVLYLVMAERLTRARPSGKPTVYEGWRVAGRKCVWATGVLMVLSIPMWVMSWYEPLPMNGVMSPFMLVQSGFGIVVTAISGVVGVAMAKAAHYAGSRIGLTKAKAQSRRVVWYSMAIYGALVITQTMQFVQQTAMAVTGGVPGGPGGQSVGLMGLTMAIGCVNCFLSPVMLGSMLLLLVEGLMCFPVISRELEGRVKRAQGVA